MYSSLTDDDFQQLYDRAKAARLAGTRLISWRAGDTEVGKESTLNLAHPNAWAELDAEFRHRWPDRVGRARITRTRAVFSAAT